MQRYGNVELDEAFVAACEAEGALLAALDEQAVRESAAVMAAGEAPEPPPPGTPGSIHEECPLTPDQAGGPHGEETRRHVRRLLLRRAVNLIAFASANWPPCRFTLEKLGQPEGDDAAERLLVRIDRLAA